MICDSLREALPQKGQPQRGMCTLVTVGRVYTLGHWFSRPKGVSHKLGC